MRVSHAKCVRVRRSAVPIKSRTMQQKSALVRFWRNREKLSLRRGILCYDGKSVVKKEGVFDVMKKMYKSSKGSGVRKIYHKLKNRYSTSRNEMSRKCLRNLQSTKGSTFVLKTKQDFDRSGPKWSRFAIKQTWWI